MDPLAIINFGEEDFARPVSQPIQPPAPRPQVFGMAERYKEYMDEFDEPEAKANTNIVMIPRYAGPKSTRCDKYKLDGRAFDVTGLPNHAQQSSVYLNQSYRFYQYGTEQARDVHGAPFVFSWEVRPFFIQRQWSRTRFEAPQANNFYDMDTRMFVKLAPYLTSKQCLDNKVKTKVTARPISEEKDNRVLYQIDIESYEPLLGFQSGWHDLDAIRPFNQQHSKFPLALQDYQLSVWKRPFEIQNHIFETMFCANDDHVGMISRAGNPKLAGGSASKHSSLCDPRKYIFSERHRPGETTLISYSDNNARQANKSVSSVMLHAPRFEIRRKTVNWVNPEDSALFWEEFKTSTRELVMGLDSNVSGSPVPDKMSIQLDTPYGLPSYFVIYLEDKGPVNTYHKRADGSFLYNDQTQTFSGGVDAVVTDLGLIDKRISFAPCHPKATGIRIKIFGDEFPITAQLDKEELEYLTHKNSHKYCDFRREMTREPIILLKLEDLGLGNCQAGYPLAKRQTIEVEITKVLLHKGSRFTYFNEAPKIEITVGLVYENFVCEGTAQRVEFLWR